MKSYKDLMVYQKSYELAVEMYREVGSKMPKEERYGLTSQIKRAATSIPLNIAEGYGRQESKGDFRRFLQIAKGSAHEMLVLIDMMYDFGQIEIREQERLIQEYEEVIKMLIGLLKYINTKTPNT